MTCPMSLNILPGCGIFVTSVGCSILIIRRRDGRLLIVHKPNSSKTFLILKFIYNLLPLCKGLTTLLCSVLYWSSSSTLGALFAAWKIALRFRIRWTKFLSIFLLLLRVHCGMQACMISIALLCQFAAARLTSSCGNHLSTSSIIRLAFWKSAFSYLQMVRACF